MATSGVCAHGSLVYTHIRNTLFVSGHGDERPERRHGRAATPHQHHTTTPVQRSTRVMLLVLADLLHSDHSQACSMWQVLRCGMHAALVCLELLASLLRFPTLWDSLNAQTTTPADGHVHTACVETLTRMHAWIRRPRKESPRPVTLANSAKSSATAMNGASSAAIWACAASTRSRIRRDHRANAAVS